MYKAYFKLNSNPFSPTPPPDFIFQSKELKEALAHFSFALENREAFLLLTGEVGTGKTTAIQAVLRLLPEGTPVALVTHTTLDPRELLEEVALRFGITGVEGKSKPVLLRELENHFEQQWAEGRQSLLILDEAHLLKPDVLEEVRLLSNLEREGGKLVQICLVGQPELVAHLQRPELRQLRQRISVRYSLRPLSERQTQDYVIHRLRAAGSPQPERIFTDLSLQQIHQATHGIPREINVIAGQSLLNAFLSDCLQVLPEHVSSVREDYGFEGLRQVQAPQSKSSENPSSPPPPPVTQLRESLEEVSTPPPGLTPKPIPLPPEHLRPHPRQSIPEPVLLTPLASPEARPKGEPVVMSTPGVPSKEPSSKGGRWIPWVLLLLVGLFLAWRYGISPMLEQDADPGAGTVAATPQRDAIDLSQGDGTQDPGIVEVTRPQETHPPAAVVDSSEGEAQDSIPEPLTLEDQFLIASEIVQGAYHGIITTQVASIQGEARAQAVLSEIQSITGLAGLALPSQVGDTEWFRILVGRFQDPREAMEALAPVLRQRIVTEVMIIPVPISAAGRLVGGTP